MRVKVLQLLPALNHGGVERGTLDLSNYLIKAGHESIVVSNGGIFEKDITRLGGIHHTLPIATKSIPSLLQYKNLAKIYLKERPDIIHIRSRFPAWIHALAMRSLKDSTFLPKVVTTFHGLYSRPWYSKSMTYADKTIAISECVQSYIVKNYKLSQSDIKLIYRGCDTSIFNKDAAESSWVDNFYNQFPNINNKKIILFPSRITGWKCI